MSNVFASVDIIGAGGTRQGGALAYSMACRRLFYTVEHSCGVARIVPTQRGTAIAIHASLASNVPTHIAQRMRGVASVPCVASVPNRAKSASRLANLAPDRAVSVTIVPVCESAISAISRT